MELTPSIIIQIASYLVMFGAFIGTLKVQYSSLKELFTVRIDTLEKKVEKHNNLVERMYKVESRLDICEERQ